MKKLVTMVSMAVALVTAVAMSAFGANVAGEVSGLTHQPPSGVQLSLAHPSVLVLAQAESGSGGDPLLTRNEDQHHNHGDCKDGEHDNGDGNCVQDHCKDGEGEHAGDGKGNRHKGGEGDNGGDNGDEDCVNSASE
jgi:hypothetical protein